MPPPPQPWSRFVDGLGSRGTLWAGALALAALLILDAWAAPRLLAPSPHDLQALSLPLGRQELVLVAAPVSGEPFLLQYEGAASLNLDVEASRARFSEESRFILAQISGQAPPATWEKIRFFSAPGSATLSMPCPMNLAIKELEPGTMITVRLSQFMALEGRQQSLMLTADKDLVIELETVAPPDNPGSTGVGCQRRLRVGDDWEKTLFAKVKLELLAARSSRLVLIFGSSKPLASQPSFLLGQKLSIYSLRLESSEGRPTAEPRIAITSPLGRASLQVTDLRAVKSDLVVTVEGTGIVSGRDAPSRLASLTRLPLRQVLIALGFLLIQAGLTVWLVRALFVNTSAREISNVPPAPEAGRPMVFISYSHADEDWKDRLVKQLGALAATGEFEIWDDRRIDAGEKWLAAIQAASQRAGVAVLLVSADYLSSPFITTQEAPALLARREAGLRVIPLIVKPCPWKEVGWLSALQVRPKDGHPLAMSPQENAEESLAALAIEVRDLLRGSRPHA
jgi:hypothetical protein